MFTSLDQYKDNHFGLSGFLPLLKAYLSNNVELSQRLFEMLQ